MQVVLHLAVIALLSGCGGTDGGDLWLADSFYQREINKTGLRVDGMTPTAIVPAECVELGRECPPDLRLIHEGQGDDSVNLRFLSALHVEVLSQALGGCCGEHAGAIQRVIDQLMSAGRATRVEERLKAIVKHYPHPLAGRNYTVLHATFFTVPDGHFEMDRLAALRASDGSVPGVMLEARATYRTTAGKARLVEAVLEVSEELREDGRRIGTPELLGRREIPRLLRADPQWAGHFFEYGGGIRRGVYWCDRSLGTGAASPWSIAYRVDARQSTALPTVTTHEASAEGAEAVQRVAGSI